MVISQTPPLRHRILTYRCKVLGRELYKESDPELDQAHFSADLLSSMTLINMIKERVTSGYTPLPYDFDSS